MTETSFLPGAFLAGAATAAFRDRGSHDRDGFERRRSDDLLARSRLPMATRQSAGAIATSLV